MLFRSQRGSIAVDVTAGTAPFLVELLRPTGNTSSFPDQDYGELVVDNLVVGNYTFRVTDANNRIASCTVELANDSCPLSIDDISLLSLDCTDGAETIIRATIVGNNGPVSTIWSGPNNVAQFNGMGEAGPLPPGTYSLVVSDGSAGCPDVSSGPIEVVNFAPVNFDLGGVLTTSPCQTDASLVISNITGGQPPYRLDVFGVDDNSNLATQLNLDANGTVVTDLGPTTGSQRVGVLVSDASGCISATEMVELVAGPTPEFSLPSADQVINPTSCPNSATGSFSLRATGGVGPYAYEYVSTPPLSPGRQLSTSPTQTDLPAGAYRIALTDANGCVDTVAVTIPEGTNAPTLSCSSRTAPPGGAGAIEFVLAGGSPPYTLEIMGEASRSISGLAAGTYVETGLPPGVYLVRITDSNGCEDACGTTITESNCTLGVDDVAVDTSACPGEAWTVAVTASGSGTLVFDWAADSLPDGPDITVFGPGSYPLSIADDFCSLDTVIELSSSQAPLTFSLPPDTLLSCNNSLVEVPLVVNGASRYVAEYVVTDSNQAVVQSAVLTVDDGAEPLTLSFSFLTPGLYQFTVVDVYNDACRNPLPQSAPLRIGTSLVEEHFGLVCADSVVIGGRVFSADAPRDTFTVATGGCGVVYQVDLNFVSPPVPDTLDMFLCEEDEFILNGEVFNSVRQQGEVAFAREGACDSVVFVRLEVDSVPLVGEYGEVVCAGDTVFYGGQVFTDERPSGLVRLPGQNFRGCDSLVFVDNFFIRTGGVRLFGDFEICRGDSIDLRFTYDGGGGIDVVVIDDRGVTYSFAGVTNNDRRTIFPTYDTNYSILSAAVSFCPGRVAGAASVTISDLELAVVPLVDPANFCVDTLGKLTAEAAGGVPPYAFNWSNGGDEPTQFNLLDTTYAVTLTDAEGCELTDSFAIVSPSVIRASFFGLPPDCPGGRGSFQLDTISGGVGFYEVSLNGEFFLPLENLRLLSPPLGNSRVFVQDASDCLVDVPLFVPPAEIFTFTLPSDTTIALGDSLRLPLDSIPPADTVFWELPDGTPVPGGAQPFVQPTRTTEYTLRVRTTSGCAYEHTFRVVVDRRLPVYAPTAFSPNGDEVNDLYRLGLNEQAVELLTFRIFDRWGVMVYEGTEGWDGLLNGQRAPPAVYVFRASVRMTDQSVRTVRGDFVLMR